MSGRSRTAAPRRREPPGRSWRQPLAIFGVAAAVRLAVAASLWTLPLVRTPKLDSAEYLAWAQRLASGDWTWPVVAQHGPGYPIALALFLTVGDGSLAAVMALQALVGGATAMLVTVIARHAFGGRAGLFAGLAYALYGPAAYVDTSILAEGLLVFLLAAALWLMLRAIDDVVRRSADVAAACAGLAFGAAALVRPTALVIAAACVLWIAIRGRARVAVVAGAACLVVLAPALARNWATSHTIAIQGYGGLNVYIGNSPRHDGRATFRPGGGWDALNAEASRAGISDAAAQDRYYLAKTWREIAAQPGAFAAVLASKALWLVQAEEVRDSHSYYFFTEQSPLVRLLPRFAILFPLACVGLFTIARLKPSRSITKPTAGAPATRTDRARRLQPSDQLILVYSISAAATVVLLVVGFRYRMPLVPALAIFAGAGIDAIVTAVEARRMQVLVFLALAATIGTLVSHVRTDPRDRNTAEEWAFTGSALVTEHKLDEAEAAYRTAIDRDPRSGLAWDGLGLTLYDAGRLGPARSALERALAIDPDNGRAAFHLALVDEREGRVVAAADGYRRALELSPADIDVARRLGDALLAIEKPADAVAPLRLAASQAPGDAAVHRQLAVALGMSNRTAEARDEMRRVVDLAPANGEAWLDLCLLSLDLNDRAGAAIALQRARALGADPGRLAFADGALARAR